jgi:hypothetical protein
MIKSKKKPRKQDVMNNILSQMKHNDKVKKRHYQEQEIQKQLSGYKQETQRLKKQKEKQKQEQKKKRMFYY